MDMVAFILYIVYDPIKHTKWTKHFCVNRICTKVSDVNIHCRNCKRCTIDSAIIKMELNQFTAAIVSCVSMQYISSLCFLIKTYTKWEKCTTQIVSITYAVDGHNSIQNFWLYNTRPFFYWSVFLLADSHSGTSSCIRTSFKTQLDLKFHRKRNETRMNLLKAYICCFNEQCINIETQFSLLEWMNTFSIAFQQLKLFWFCMCRTIELPAERNWFSKQDKMQSTLYCLRVWLRCTEASSFEFSIFSIENVRKFIICRKLLPSWKSLAQIMHTWITMFDKHNWHSFTLRINDWIVCLFKRFGIRQITNDVIMPN